MGETAKNIKTPGLSVAHSAPDNTITLDILRQIVPKATRRSMDQATADDINKVFHGEEHRENFRENFLSYSSVLQDGKFKIGDYINAVKYVSIRMLGETSYNSWIKTFPQRYQRLMNQGKTKDHIAGYVACYSKGRLVNLIMEQTLVPHHILNQDMYQKALNVQASLMMGAKSEKVRTDAANSLLTHLKTPETHKIELDIGIKEDTSIIELRKTTLELVAQQKAMLVAGAMTTEEVAHSRLHTRVIEADIEEAEVVD